MKSSETCAATWTPSKLRSTRSDGITGGTMNHLRQNNLSDILSPTMTTGDIAVLVCIVIMVVPYVALMIWWSKN